MRKVSFIVLFGLIATLFAGTADARPSTKAEKADAPGRSLLSAPDSRTLEAAISTLPGKPVISSSDLVASSPAAGPIVVETDWDGDNLIITVESFTGDLIWGFDGVDPSDIVELPTDPNVRIVLDAASTCFTVVIKDDVSDFTLDSAADLGVLCEPTIEVDLEITAVLEGAWDSTTDQMTTHLGDTELTGALLFLPEIYSAALGWDPVDAPSLSPWQYGNSDLGVVDWVIVELTEIDGLTRSFSQPAILRADGSITAYDDADNFSMVVPSESEYRVTVHHRNHLSLASQLSHSVIDGVLVDDLSVNGTTPVGSATVTDSTDAALTALAAGNYRWDRIIQVTDYDVWAADPAILFEAAYEQANGNLDDAVQATDYDLWFFNKAKLASPYVTQVIVQG